MTGGLKNKICRMDLHKASTRNAELLVVFAEDIAAILGLVLAFIFILLSLLTGNTIFDAIGSLCIGGFLIIIAFFLMMRVQSLIIGQSADPELSSFIEKIIKKDKNILEIYNMVTLQMGPRVMLSAKIRMNEKLSIKPVRKLTSLNNKSGKNIRKFSGVLLNPIWQIRRDTVYI